MARITSKDLKLAIEGVNALLVKSGSVYTYRYGSRNNYHAVDRYKNDKCHGLLDCAEPPRVLIEKLNEDYEYYLGKKD